jgi:hypothetical protein
MPEINLIRIFYDEDNHLRCNIAYNLPDWQVIGLLEAFKTAYMKSFTTHLEYNEHFQIDKSFEDKINLKN